MLFSERVTNVALVTQTMPTNWKILKSVEVVLCNRVTDIPLATQKVPTTKKIQKRLATTRPRNHVPALTVTSGGRGVGPEVACLVKSSRGRERRGIQDVDALIPETETWTLRVRKKFPDWTSGCLLVAVALGLGMVALGVRCPWPVVCSPGPVSFLRGPRLGKARNWPVLRPKRKGTDLGTGSDP